VSGRADRSAAYAELVSGLLEARHDAASARFDAEIAAAEADGRIDERTARVLRWWQRESVRAVVEHARAVIPPALGAIDIADEDAARQNDDAAQAWDRATSRALPVLGLSGLHDDAYGAIAEKAGPAGDAVPQTEEAPAESADPADGPAAPTAPWAIPAARTAAAAPEDGPRRLIVAGLNPLPRGGPSGHSRRDTMLDRRKD
jgi:hypothetical protein